MASAPMTSAAVRGGVIAACYGRHGGRRRGSCAGAGLPRAGARTRAGARAFPVERRWLLRGRRPGGRSGAVGQAAVGGPRWGVLRTGTTGVVTSGAASGPCSPVSSPPSPSVPVSPSVPPSGARSPVPPSVPVPFVPPLSSRPSRSRPSSPAVGSSGNDSGEGFGAALVVGVTVVVGGAVVVVVDGARVDVVVDGGMVDEVPASSVDAVVEEEVGDDGPPVVSVPSSSEATRAPTSAPPSTMKPRMAARTGNRRFVAVMRAGGSGLPGRRR